MASAGIHPLLGIEWLLRLTERALLVGVWCVVIGLAAFVFAFWWQRR
jgi:hypothetical protein